MSQMIPQADGRKKGRLSRRKNHCTICDNPLPSDSLDWGLVWEGGVHGVCFECLLKVRENIGYNKGNLSSKKL